MQSCSQFHVGDKEKICTESVAYVVIDFRSLPLLGEAFPLPFSFPCISQLCNFPCFVAKIWLLIGLIIMFCYPSSQLPNVIHVWNFPI